MWWRCRANIPDTAWCSRHTHDIRGEQIQKQPATSKTRHQQQQNKSMLIDIRGEKYRCAPRVILIKSNMDNCGYSYSKVPGKIGKYGSSFPEVLGHLGYSGRLLSKAIGYCRRNSHFRTPITIPTPYPIKRTRAIHRNRRIKRRTHWHATPRQGMAHCSTSFTEGSPRPRRSSVARPSL